MNTATETLRALLNLTETFEGVAVVATISSYTTTQIAAMGQEVKERGGPYTPQVLPMMRERYVARREMERAHKAERIFCPETGDYYWG